MLYPIHQKNDRLVFVDLRGLLKKSPVKEFNVGGGYRWLSSDKQKLYGAYGFFDRKMSENNNWFNQLTIGGELKTEQLKVLGLNAKGLSIGGNVYLPVGTKSHEIGREVTDRYFAKAKPYQADKFTISYWTETDTTIDTEYALTGIDLEVGHAIPKVKGLKGYLGGYYFSHSKVDKVMGPRATLIYDLSSLMRSKLALIDHLELETSIQYDKPRGTTWYAGFRLQMQLGSSKDKPKLKGLEKQLTAFVRRDLDVVDEQGREFDREITPEATWLKETNQPYVGKIVSTEAELKALTGGKAKDVEEVNIIGVKGIIPVTGVIYTDNTTAAAIRLNYGQSITGQGLTFKANDGKEYTVKIVNSDQSIAGAVPGSARGGITLKGANGKVGHLIQVYTNAGLSRTELEARVQRIEDLILTVPENGQDYLTEQADDDGLRSSVISNTTGKLESLGTNQLGNKVSFGHVVIDNINANSNVHMRLNDQNYSGKLTLVNSTFSVRWMLTEYGGMVDLMSLAAKQNTAGGLLSSPLIIESIANNKLLYLSSGNINSDTGANSYGMYFDFLNGPVTNNNITVSLGSKSAGIYVARHFEDTGSVFNNIVTVTGDITASGVDFENVMVLAPTIMFNTFNVTSIGGDAFGLNQQTFHLNYRDIDIVNITDNTFNSFGFSSNPSISDQYSYGLRHDSSAVVKSKMDIFKDSNTFGGAIGPNGKVTTK